MELAAKINGAINGFVWGPIMLTFFVGTGVFLTIFLGFPQVRYFARAWREVIGMKKRGVRNEGDKSISAFAAMATALAATVGTGNIAGVSTAIHLGGPGAVVWMLISALFGMCTKFTEVLLAVEYRTKDDHGDWRGGTMYILEHGANKKWLAKIFAFLTFLASFGIWSAVQANSAAEGLNMAFGIDRMHCGIGLCVLFLLVVVGGIQSLSVVTTMLVPLMALFYIIGALVVVLMHAAELPGAIGAAFQSAFNDPSTIAGGLAGWGVKEAITRGIARGVFSNEAGMGSAPMAHASAQTDHPVRQGLFGIFEVCVDTIIICTLTSLVVLTTGTLTARPELTGAQLALAGFEVGLGETGRLVLSLGLVLFAFSTLLGGYWYSETAVVYLFGVKAKIPQKILFTAAIFIGAAGSVVFGASANDFLALLWDIADTLNGLMAIPNLIGLLLLCGVARRLVKDFDAKLKSGELPQ